MQYESVDVFVAAPTDAEIRQREMIMSQKKQIVALQEQVEQLQVKIGSSGRFPLIRDLFSEPTHVGAPRQVKNAPA